MKATHFMALALALTLVGVPTFALSADLSTSPESFKALSHVTSTDETSPAPLTDQELAKVEGSQSFPQNAFAFSFLQALSELGGLNPQGAFEWLLTANFIATTSSATASVTTE